MSTDMTTPSGVEAGATQSYLTAPSNTSSTVAEGDTKLMREAMKADPTKGKGADAKAANANEDNDEEESKSAKSTKNVKSTDIAKSAKAAGSMPDFDPLADINIMQL